MTDLGSAVLRDATWALGALALLLALGVIWETAQLTEPPPCQVARLASSGRTPRCVNPTP